ncbi:MAG: hypothetical protein CVV02_11060 [Firmicutes bacterium HGW-Firmicutes-7]|nr:MAG: hypothetical protein CVV02_11060 [Firmicutes bacterium HGW-Firmicutes-7]
MRSIDKYLLMNIEKKINYSFILLCYNQWKLTLQAMKTLIKSLDQLIISEGVEIILVDNGSIELMDEEVSSVLKERKYKGFYIGYYRLDENMGYPVGINYGISKASGNVLIVLNNDLIFTQGWLNPLLNILKEKQDIGVAVPYLSNASGLQHIGYYESDLDRIHQFSEAFMKSHQRETLETNRVIGACMVVRRDVIDQVGGNDFWFSPGHYDDDDWCIRIRIAGYRLVVMGNSFVYHIGSASFGASKWDVKQVISSNKKKFLTKWQLDSIESSRDQLIKSNDFYREKHYEPIGFSGFSKDENTTYKQLDGFLFVADWYSDVSTWRIKFEEILHGRKSERYFIWAPNSYYNIVGCKDLDERNIYGLNVAVPNINLLQFINSFNSVIKIENDMINSYIIKIKQENK